MATATVEDYLKRIYLLQQAREGAIVPVGALAEALGVVPGTATVMVQRLARAGRVRYAPYEGVALTDEGSRLALDVLRRHRLVESFLVAVLELDWSEVHEEAERLEHAISEKLLERIDDYLGRPRFDPHGDPIPDASGSLRERRTHPLAEDGPGTRGRVARVLAQDEAFLRFAAEHGLRPGTVVAVLARDRVGGTVTVAPEEGPPVTIGLAAARKILIEPIG